MDPALLELARSLGPIGAVLVVFMMVMRGKGGSAAMTVRLDDEQAKGFTAIVSSALTLHADVRALAKEVNEMRTTLAIHQDRVSRTGSPRDAGDSGNYPGIRGG